MPDEMNYVFVLCCFTSACYSPAISELVAFHKIVLKLCLPVLGFSELEEGSKENDCLLQIIFRSL